MSTAARKLGILWPDDGQPQPDWEFVRLAPWLGRHGLGGVEPVVAWTRAARFHTRENLLVTGSLRRLEPAARRLADLDCDAILWACTSGSFIGGLAWAHAQARALAAATGRPCSSTTLALIAATRALGAARVDLLGAYPEPVTRALAGCLTDAGTEVGVVDWLDSPDGPASHAMDIVAAARAFAARHPGDGDPLLVPDTAIDTLDRVEALERETARPVVTANQATLWQGLGMLGVEAPVAGAGLLLRLAGRAAAARA